METEKTSEIREALLAREDGGEKRALGGIWGRIIFFTALAMSVYEVWFTTLGILDVLSFRAIFVIFSMVLTFLLYPYKGSKERSHIPWTDVLWALLSLASGVYIVVEYPSMVERLGFTTTADVIFGIIITVLIIEATRRTIGLALPLVAICMLAYAVFGDYVPGVLGHKGFSITRIVSQIYCTTEGLYSTTTGAVAQWVFPFMIFGAFLRRSGAADFFDDFAYAVTGRIRGGPAQASVVASGLFGTVSGSAVANVMVDGYITIPMMQRAGFPPYFAAAVEATASSGGQIMPPVMGSAAFIMAEWTNVPYFYIIKIAAIPAILYYWGTAVVVYVQASKLGLKGLGSEQLPFLKQTLKKGYRFLIPLFTLIAVLMLDFTPAYAALVGCISIIFMSWLKRETRIGIRGMIEALVEGAKDSIAMSAACITSGIVVGIVGLTGIGLTFTSMVVSLSQGSLFLAICLIALGATILGMGLPTTAAYIVAAVLAIPALTNLGVDLIAAHMAVLWFSQTGNVTPPVCLAAYAASSIAKSPLMKTGWTATKLAKCMWMVPFLFIYSPIITGTRWEIFYTGFTAFIGLIPLCAAWDGYLIDHCTWYERIMLGASGVILFAPLSYGWSVLGLVLLLIPTYLEWQRNRVRGFRGFKSFFPPPGGGMAIG
jgi:TRAP transporter 4TM/12TM fusion protein